MLPSTLPKNSENYHSNVRAWWQSNPGAVMSRGHALITLEFRKLPFKLSVPGGNSTREYIRQLDVLSEILCVSTKLQTWKCSEDMEARKCGNSSTLRGIVEISTSSWKCKLTVQWNCKSHQNPLKKPRPRSLPYSLSLFHFSHQMSSRSH